MIKQTSYLIFFSFLVFIQAEGSIVGNPSSPGIFTCGLFTKNQYLYLRGGYFWDNIYKAKYKDEGTDTATKSILKLRSQGGIATLNIINRFDLYGLVGVAKMNLDSQVRPKEDLYWAAGMKILLLKIKNFDLSIDGKYSRTNQDVEYFIIDGEVFPIYTPGFGFRIEDYLASCSLSYRSNIVIPYVGATYLFSTVHPYPGQKGLIRFPHPNEDIISDFISDNLENKKKWGMVVGVGIISCKMVSINIEGRIFDQNAINATAEIRF